jgi:hypothetical protein
MFFFAQLESIGIDHHQLKRLTPADVLKIEKKLIAENRLNNTLSKNDIQQVIEILNNYLPEIQLISGNEMFLAALSDKESRYFDRLYLQKQINTPKTKALIANYFRDNLSNYFLKNIKDNNWKVLLAFMKYKNMLPLALVQEQIDRLEEKLESTLTFLHASPTEKAIISQLPYLHNSDFFRFLYVLDTNHFDPFLHRLVAFLKQQQPNLKKTAFDNILEALADYKPLNQRFLISGHTLKKDRLGSKKNLAMLFSCMCMFLIIYLNKENTGGSTYIQPDYIINRFEAEKYNSASDQKKFTTEQLNIDLLNFDDARKNVLNNPVTTKSVKATIPLKYTNPFTNESFSRSYEVIKQGSKNLHIFNKSDQECIIMAFYELDNRSSESRFENTSVFPLYIPPYDSIHILFPLKALRFYTGKELKNFNTYQKKRFNDSLDLKFSCFTKIDSVLFTRQFRFEYAGSESLEAQKLTLSKPDEDTFKITFIGNYLVTTEAGYRRKPFAVKPTVIPSNRPLLISLKNRKTLPITKE